MVEEKSEVEAQSNGLLSTRWRVLNGHQQSQACVKKIMCQFQILILIFKKLEFLVLEIIILASSPNPSQNRDELVEQIVHDVNCRRCFLHCINMSNM